MANGTVASPPPQPSRTNVAPLLGANTVRCDQFIEQKLDHTQRQVKLVDVLSGLMILGVGTMMFLLVVAVLEHWVAAKGLPFGVRFALWLGWLAVAGAFAWRNVLPPLVHRINPIYAAQTIEQHSPTLKNSLINFLLLRSHREEVAPVVFRAMEQRAAVDLSRAEIEMAVDRGRMVRMAYMLAGTVALFALYLAFSPKNPLISAARVLWPWSSLSAPTRVHIDEVKPGDAVAYRGEHQKIEADVSGLRANEEVIVQCRTADNETVDEQFVLKRVGEGNHFECAVPQGSEGLQQDIIYSVMAGDASTPTMKIEVRIPPLMTIDRVDYHFPAYTGLKDRSQANLGDIKAVEGTRVTIHATANMEIASAYIDVNCAGLQEIGMHSQGCTAVGGFTLGFVTDKPDEPPRQNMDSYQVMFKNEQGLTNHAPVRYRVEVERDLPPEVQIVEPKDDDVAVAVDGQLPIRVRAEDIDFALRRVVLQTEHEGRPLHAEMLLDMPAPQKPWQGALVKPWNFAPAAMGLKAGDVVKLWAEADDNKEPIANHVATGPKMIRILAAGQVPQPQDKPKSGGNSANQSGGDGKPDAGDKHGQGKANEGGGQSSDSSDHGDKDNSNKSSSQQGNRGTPNDNGSQGTSGRSDPANGSPSKAGSRPPSGADASSMSPNNQGQNSDKDDKTADDAEKKPVNQDTDPGDAIQKSLDDLEKKKSGKQQDQLADASQQRPKNSPDQSDAGTHNQGENNPSQPQQDQQNGTQPKPPKDAGEQPKNQDQPQSQKPNQDNQPQQSGEDQSGSKQSENQESSGGQDGSKNGGGEQKQQKGGGKQGKTNSGEQNGGDSSAQNSPQQSGTGNRPQSQSGSKSGGSSKQNNASQSGNQQSGNNDQNSAGQTGQQKSSQPGDPKSAENSMGQKGQSPAASPEKTGENQAGSGTEKGPQKGAEKSNQDSAQANSNQQGAKAGDPSSAANKPQGTAGQQEGSKTGGSQAGTPGKRPGDKSGSERQPDKQSASQAQSGEQPGQSGQQVQQQTSSGDGKENASNNLGKAPSKKPSGPSENNQLAQASGKMDNKSQQSPDAKEGDSQSGGSGKPEKNGEKKAGEKQGGQDSGSGQPKQDGKKASADKQGGGSKQEGGKEEGGKDPSGGAGAQQNSKEQSGKSGKSKGGSDAKAGDDHSGQKEQGTSGDPSNQNSPGAPDPQVDQQPGSSQSGKSNPGKASDGMNDKSDKSQSPGNSDKDNNNNTSDQAGDRKGSKGGGAGGGGKSDKSGKGQAGKESDAPDGGSISKEKGAGDTGTKAGDAVKSNSQTGSQQKRKTDQGGNETANNSDTADPSSKASNPSNESESSKTSDSNSSSGKSGDASAKQSGTAGTGQPTGGGVGGPNAAAADSSPVKDSGAADANLEYTKKQVDLALTHLKDQMKNDKSDLLKDLGWSKDDARRFVDNWRKKMAAAQQSGPQAAEAKHALDESLRNLGLRPKGTRMKAGGTTTDAAQSVHDSGQSEAPAEWSEAADRYSRALGHVREK